MCREEAAHSGSHLRRGLVGVGLIFALAVAALIGAIVDQLLRGRDGERL